MISRTSRVVVVLLLGLATRIAAQQPATRLTAATTPTGPIKVGCMLPSSPKTITSKAVELALSMAIKDFNAPAVLKRNVTLLPCLDSQCASIPAAIAMNRLISQGVIAVVGALCSDESIAARPLAAAKQVLLVSPGATSPALSRYDDYFFRTVPSDVYQGKVLAQLVYNQGGRNAVLVSGAQEAYSQGLYLQFVSEFTRLGGKVVFSDAFLPGASELSIKTDIAQMMAATPDSVVFLTNNNTYTARVAQLLKENEKGFNVRLYAGDAAATPKLPQLAGPKAVEGLLVTDVSAGTAAFRKAFEVAGKGNVTYVHKAAHAYDAMMVVLKAYARAAAPKKGPQLLAAMMETNTKGASGPLKFDAYGDLEGSTAYYSVLEFGSKGELATKKQVTVA